MLIGNALEEAVPRLMRLSMNAVLSTTAGLALAVLAAEAHHSLTGIYDSSREVILEGAVVEFRFVNPHPYLIIDVEKGGSGSGQWRLEMDNRSELSAIGIDAETFRSGDRVVVSGNPGRTQAQSMYLRRLDRPVDGLRYEQVGSTPRISRKAG